MRVVVELIAEIRVARGAGRGLARSLILARARTRIGSLLRLVQVAAASVSAPTCPFQELRHKHPDGYIPKWLNRSLLSRQ